MAYFTKVHGVDVIAPDQFVGRKLHFINIAGLSAASAAAGNADLLAVVEAVESLCTIEVLGSFVAGTDTELNMIISGYEDDNTFARLDTATGLTVTEVVF